MGTGAPKYKILSNLRFFAPERQQYIPIVVKFSKVEYTIGPTLCRIWRSFFGKGWVGNLKFQTFVTIAVFRRFFAPVRATVCTERGDIWCGTACHMFTIVCRISRRLAKGVGWYGYPAGFAATGRCLRFLVRHFVHAGKYCI